MIKVIVKGYIVVPDKDILAVIQELPNHITQTRNETGCLVFDVSRDPLHSNRFNVYEEFSSRQAFAYHQQRMCHSKWGTLTLNVERHYEVIEST